MPILSKTFDDPASNPKPKPQRKGVPLEEIYRVEKSMKKVPIDQKVFKHPNRSLQGKIRKMRPAA